MKFDINFESAIERACNAPRNERIRIELQEEKERFVRLWKRCTDQFGCVRLLDSFCKKLDSAGAWIESEFVCACANDHLGFRNKEDSLTLRQAQRIVLSLSEKSSRN